MVGLQQRLHLVEDIVHHIAGIDGILIDFIVLGRATGVGKGFAHQAYLVVGVLDGGLQRLSKSALSVAT